ncbi:DinB family protein [Seonamhaeicola marinus]|uniref:DinB family protein n=1 Tax=Seonamhaeicola marinus TaxID=1912246 RepID=A0A5D0HK52_9FLAO|nr:DinB family protein [Seonamhaeicola marinus]TYA71635.1 DinB family protein [Seonamhaeicola marinus]
MTKRELQTSEYNEFYSGYLSQLSDDTELVSGFEANSKTVLDFFQSIPHEKLEYRYDEGKWSIKEVFQHLIDTERVFQFRCFHIGRHDKTPLPGFEQNDYIAPSKADAKSIETLITEFKTVRQSFIDLLNGLTNEDLNQVGIANGGNTSARAIAFINLGHYLHHINITKERYL